MENLLQDEPHDEREFKYNFITIPWDDRTKWSKISVVFLLTAIFVATIGCVINSFIMQFKGEVAPKITKNLLKAHVNCQIVKTDDYAYVAKIHSTKTRELVCVGALIFAKAVLTNGACAKNKQVRIYIGRLNEPYCKKGFAVTAIEKVHHEGILGKNLALLITQESMMKCGKMIQMHAEINEASRAYVIGRALHAAGARSISRQPVRIIGKGRKCSCLGLPTKHLYDVICIRSLANCPVLAGDLLIQGSKLVGIASTSLYRGKGLGEVCFADLGPSINELTDINNTDSLDFE